MKKLKIRSGWFWGAGSKYDWTKDGYHINGIGVARKYFDEPVMEITVDGMAYTCDMKEALIFVRKYKSVMQMKSIKLGVISRSLLIPVTKEGQHDFQADKVWFDKELP